MIAKTMAILAAITAATLVLLSLESMGQTEIKIPSDGPLTMLSSLVMKLDEPKKQEGQATDEKGASGEYTNCIWAKIPIPGKGKFRFSTVLFIYL